MKDIAARVVWWREPSESLADRKGFLAQLMTIGTWREVQFVKDVMGWEAFRETLTDAPPGVFDARSWIYWHTFFGIAVPEMPRRSLT